MEWKKITAKITPFVTKAKEYGNKALTFTEEQIQMTPLFLKKREEYDAFLTMKRGILVAYDSSDDLARTVRSKASMWAARAFMDNAKLRFLNISEYPELAAHIECQAPIEMRIRFEGEESFRFHTFQEVEDWWKSPRYVSPESEVSSSDLPKNPDPLASQS